MYPDSVCHVPLEPNFRWFDCEQVDNRFIDRAYEDLATFLTGPRSCQFEFLRPYDSECPLTARIGWP